MDVDEHDHLGNAAFIAIPRLKGESIASPGHECAISHGGNPPPAIVDFVGIHVLVA